MTIDEAIARTREIAKRNREQWKNCPADRRDIEHQTCEQCAEEHEQLAEWLEELKMYRESSYGELHSMVYNKAIDDCKELTFREVVYCDSLNDRTEFRELAEQLKAKKTISVKE